MSVMLERYVVDQICLIFRGITFPGTVLDSLGVVHILLWKYLYESGELDFTEI